MCNDAARPFYLWSTIKRQLHSLTDLFDVTGNLNESRINPRLLELLLQRPVMSFFFFSLRSCRTFSCIRCYFVLCSDKEFSQGHDLQVLEKYIIIAMIRWFITFHDLHQRKHIEIILQRSQNQALWNPTCCRLLIWCIFTDREKVLPVIKMWFDLSTLGHYQRALLTFLICLWVLYQKQHFKTVTLNASALLPYREQTLCCAVMRVLNLVLKA